MVARKQVRPRHVPQRSCVVCRRKTDKRELTRIVRTPEEGVVVDLTGKRSGRGAYLCSRTECWDRALHSDVLAKALRTTISDEERAALAAHRPRETAGTSA